jgi:putative Ca2+/H+ antiporter (TMEM165/GDT1 family)
MDWRTFLFSFGVIFLAELGDKTQLAVIGLTGKTGSPVSVFSAAVISFAIITIIGVVVGRGIFEILPKEYIKIGAGIAFIGVGILILGGRI